MRAELYQPVTSGSRYFLAPELFIGRSDLTLRQDDEDIAKYIRDRAYLGMSAGREVGTSGEFRAIVRRGQGELERSIGEPTLPELDYDIADAVLLLDLDSLDIPDFPTSGYRFKVAQRNSVEQMGASHDFSDLGGTISIPFTFGRNTIALGSEYGVTFDDRPIENAYAFGGFLDISGYNSRSLLASDYYIGRALYYRRFSEMKTPIFSFSFFAGANFEFASLRSDVASVEDDTSIIAGGVFIGADTPILPTYLGVGMNEDNDVSVYLNFGRVGLTDRVN